VLESSVPDTWVLVVGSSREVQVDVVVVGVSDVVCEGVSDGEVPVSGGPRISEVIGVGVLVMVDVVDGADVVDEDE
jgi:hypothetical protein